MKLTYIYHSGFAIETTDATIVIDYYNGPNYDEPTIVLDKLLKKDQKLYVLVSHGHYDHFSPEIMEWKAFKENITYIISRDVENSSKEKLNNVFFIDKDEQYKDEIIQIDAFGSTDQGVSFKIKIDNKTIFHAGDLNNWHWNEESTVEEVKEAEDFFSRELSHLEQSTAHLDVAMFPVDPRLGKDYMKGVEQFVKAIQTDLLVPMHFDEAYTEASKVKNIGDKYNTATFVPTKKGETFDLDILKKRI